MEFLAWPYGPKLWLHQVGGAGSSPPGGADGASSGGA